MAKRSRTKARDVAAPEGEVGPRQPCPCGSGKRYKACHGAPGGAGDVYVGRPFEGLPSECDLVALRELVPAATRAADRSRTPTAPSSCARCCRWPRRRWCATAATSGWGCRCSTTSATRRATWPPCSPARSTPSPGDGRRRAHRPARPRAAAAGPGHRRAARHHRARGLRLLGRRRRRPGRAADALVEQANSPATPTARLASVEAAYWTDVGTKEHLRWVMPEPEDQLLDALARLHAAGTGRAGPRRPAGRDVPRARPARAGLGPRGRHRRRGARGAGRPVRARTSTRRSPTTSDLTTEQRAARVGPGQPSGHDPLTGRTAQARSRE